MAPVRSSSGFIPSLVGLAGSLLPVVRLFRLWSKPRVAPQHDGLRVPQLIRDHANRGPRPDRPNGPMVSGIPGREVRRKELLRGWVDHCLPVEVARVPPAESGTPLGDVCRQVGVSEATFYQWKRKFAHLGVSEMRMRQLEDENDRLKRLVADLTLDKHMLSGPPTLRYWRFPTGATIIIRNAGDFRLISRARPLEYEAPWPTI